MKKSHNCATEAKLSVQLTKVYKNLKKLEIVPNSITKHYDSFKIKYRATYNMAFNTAFELIRYWGNIVKYS